MYRPRVIPVLLLKNNGLVKSLAFEKHRYIGDPINAVKIFNDLKADELIFLDIMATKENRLISLDFVRNVGEEAHMPFAVGGGIKTIDDIRKIINAGAERVIIGSQAAIDPDFIAKATATFGSTTIIVCMDVKKDFLGREKVWIQNGRKQIAYSTVVYAKLMEELGVGELIVQSITRDGTMEGYNLELIKKVSENVKIPVVALGGATNLQNMKQAFTEGYANGLAAGSLFVYFGTKKGVLINYPENINRYFLNND